ncbi:peptidoglycan editing factor PgeF [Sulfobacillus thermosulfidooxidans]|uniref:peptidoglycan editing factor PgeF n=1 Tax=Sulfobacillus thermosulfidooxidans TaxID=28034 RepID=UPI0003067C86|nr:peptidoglycan editing factor PgeF [Sulfobacillus thermosulfidooxidans]OLZ09792.1 hypothetical protein BFX05_12650 [Sulfobacillus thermosulfidooxidans]OLZ16262.1 hypothetical protein BFX06_02390 [Sulfobacillus thermosulfidooxidans]OLZ18251.1 hypothetical protein BFX07_07735 [Sulfobacillus thermosulfidooxidans]
MTRWIRHKSPYLSWQVTEGIQAIFTTRQGGVSFSPFDTLNISFNVGDLPSAVMENRRRVLADIDHDLSQLVMAEQVHHNQVAWVAPHDAGAGAMASRTALPGLDGLLTHSDRVVLGMGFADCVPIFIAVPQDHVVGLLHAGWRGTVRGVQRQAIELLKEEGIDLRQIHIGIGPSIGPCCYEVDERVANEFRAQMGGDAPLVATRAGHYLLDLWEANRQQLVELGIPNANIDISRWCTACHGDQFFSYRRDHGHTGRMGGFICMSK